MRRRTSAPSLPPFSDPRGSFYELPMKPPFSFEGMTARVFPLRANLDSLQRFCNSYLNFIPPEAGRFRAVVPYVYYIMLDYGRMAIDIANIGWFSQREFLFCIPIQWYRVVDGQWQFHDWATVTPFIYVNNDMSMQIGRTVYGWPKAIASLTPTTSAWMTNPLAHVNQATVSTMVFPELYEGKPFEWQTFIEVNRDAPMSNLGFPPNGESPILPWMVASKVANAMIGFGRDAVSTLAGLGILPLSQGSTMANAMSVVKQMMQWLLPYHPTGEREMPWSLLPVNLTANTLNLKQFRHNSNPETYCFQALTNGPMRMTAFNRAGLLGEARTLLGDVSGGYSIKLHQWPSLPIAETLGLDVARSWNGPGTSVVELKPVMPFWYDVNMEYLTGYNVCWRAEDRVWHDQEGRTYKQQPRDREDAEEDEKINSTVISALDAAENALFNTTLGGALDAVAGPFQFTEMTMRVLPLLAQKSKLKEFLHNYLNEPLEGANFRFSLWAPLDDDKAPELGYVYLTANNFDNVMSTSNNVGDWAKYELAFLIPVRKEEKKKDGSWETTGVGLFPAFTYVDNVMAAAARSEVLGIPTAMAVFEQPGSCWMDTGGTSAGVEQMLLRVKSEVLPAVAVGTKARTETILEISSGAPMGGLNARTWHVNAGSWSAVLRAEQERKKSAKLASKPEMKRESVAALALLDGSIPFAIYTLKQFRDVANPNKACYQSIACIPRTIKDVLDIQEIEDSISVLFHEFPTQPIVELLGLVGYSTGRESAGIAYAVQPIRPFSMRVTMHEALGEDILMRSGTTTWTRPKSRSHMPGILEPVAQGETPATIHVASVDAILEKGDPRRIKRGTGEHPASPDELALTRDIVATDIGKAIDAIDPQMVVEALLSREVGNWSENTRWNQGLQTLENQFVSIPEGIAGDPAKLKAMELTFFANVMAPLWDRPGEHSFQHAMALTERFPDFAKARAQLEKSWDALSGCGFSSSITPKSMVSNRTTAPTDAEVLADVINFVTALETIRTLPINDSSVEVRATDARIRELLTILGAGIMNEKPDKTIGPEPPVDPGTAVERALLMRDLFQIAFGLGTERCEQQLQAIFKELARAWQKPDFCIRRDVFGPERDTLLPLAESWDENWYYGPNLELQADYPTGKTVMIAKAIEQYLVHAGGVKKIGEDPTQPPQ